MRHILGLAQHVMGLAVDHNDHAALERLAQMFGQLEFIARTLSQSLLANTENRFNVGTAGLTLAGERMQKLAAEVNRG